MNKLLLCLAFALLMVSLLAVHAQDEDPFADLDPEAIFAEGVEVVGVRYSTSRNVVVDGSNRVVRVLNQDTGEWRTFPYDSDVSLLENYWRIRDGIVLFNAPYAGANILYDPPLEEWPPIWMLDTETGEFTRAETVCGSFARDLLGRGTLVIVHDETVQRSSACNTETGEYTALLPFLGDDRPLSIESRSPNGDWLILSHGNFLDADYYGFEVGTGNLNYLGEMRQGDERFGFKWLNESNGILLNIESCQSCPKNIFRFNVLAPNSIEYLMNGGAEYRDSPPRYEYLASFWEHRSWANWDSSCRAETFNLTTEKFSRYYFGEFCAGVVQRVTDNYYFVSRNETLGRDVLYRLNAETYERNVILSDGRLLGLGGISLDGRYAVVGLKDEHFSSYLEDPLRLSELLDPFSFPDYGLPTRRIAVFDLERQQYVAEIQDWSPSFEWINDEWFVQQCNGYYDEFQIVHVSENGIQEYRIDGMFCPELPTYNDQLVLNGINGNPQTLLFDFSSARLIPLMKSDPNNHYGRAQWSEDRELEVKFYLGNGSYGNEGDTVTYTIRIPTPEGEP
jgi:hypothetical protein